MLELGPDLPARQTLPGKLLLFFTGPGGAGDALAARPQRTWAPSPGTAAQKPTPAHLVLFTSASCWYMDSVFLHPSSRFLGAGFLSLSPAVLLSEVTELMRFSLCCLSEDRVYLLGADSVFMELSLSVFLFPDGQFKSGHCTTQFSSFVSPGFVQ